MVAAPVFVPGESTPPAEDAAPAMTGRVMPLATGDAGHGWAVEHHPATDASSQPDGDATTFTFRLAPGRAAGQFAALVHPLDPGESFDEIRFRVTADRPMRFSVQVRLPGGGEGGERWVRSVYADTTPRDVRVRLEDFSPADRTVSRRPVAARLQSLLLVVDTPHTAPGTAGQLQISDVALHAPGAPPALTSGR